MATPFGIRRRLRRLFGIPLETPAAAVQAPAPVTLTVVSVKGEETKEAAAESTLLAISGKMKHPIASGCSDSSCGTCRVEVLEGGDNISGSDARERATLKENGYPSTLRLACRAELVGGSAKVKAFELV
jgi:ferredoxin